MIDLIVSKYDAGVQLGGRYLDQDMIALRLGPDLRQVAVASPEYIRSCGTPNIPMDLHQHNCLCWRSAEAVSTTRWMFERGSSRFELDLSGSMTFDDRNAAVTAALAGIGIANRFPTAFGEAKKS